RFFSRGWWNCSTAQIGRVARPLVKAPPQFLRQRPSQSQVAARSGLKLALAFVLLAGSAMLVLSLNSCGVSAASRRVGPIQHVVVIFQENRTPDNLFHDPVLIARGADIASEGVNSKGQMIPFVEVELASSYDLQHGHREFLELYDGGKMDGADLN